jgi:glyoxylase-like metal-dependent hydrolase (beta-lactamase superfamily II)
MPNAPENPDMNTVRSPLLCFGLLFLIHGPLHAQRDWDAVEIEVTTLRGGVHMLTAAGGNLGVFVGSDGTLIVDADYAEMSERILDRVTALARETPGADPTLRYLVNTHWHFDHTSGNEAFAGAGAVIISHEGVGRLLAGDQVMPALGGREVAAAPIQARPVLTFNDRLNMTFNGDLLHFVHLPDAHTDGDAIVHFRDADVIHMGDLFFNGTYPFIDVDHGGNLPGMVRALEDVLAHSNETTLFIPGHGPLAERADLLAYTDMLRTVRDRVQALIDDGMTREEVIAQRPTADLDETWGGGGGFRDAEFWVGLVYDGMVGMSG